MHGLKESTKQVELFAALSRNATANGTSVDLGNGAQYLLAVLNVGSHDRTDGNETLDVRLQDSDDNVTFADVATGAFAQVTAAGQKVIETKAVRRYIRGVATFAGTTPGPSVFSLVAVASGLPVRGSVAGI